MFENTKLNVLANIDEYISDITYENEKGWLSLIIEKHSCNIKRINESIFKIEFCIENEDI